ncbi:hypothetical protein BKA59DRAFT_491509 [Fusarium tricinctum]|uniref:PD-(D/E)XK nuclease-like domain-containing protein n=1 Tax=Fusarium tricinctum TaxID=61284 RepID=A0A8K0S3A1_9HYPO|nr:hypothetical protein BKA59DRAFT_491509 [Fusarium tricinctum]
MAAIYEDKDFSCSPHRDALGLTPSPEDVLYILECAADCLRMGRPEAAWNNESRARSSVWSSSTASIVPDYRIRFAPDKKIDFCVYLDPRYDMIDTNVASLVDSVRARLLLLSINPTDDLSLKRPGEGLDTANLQVATFLTAHLTLLQRLVDAGAAVHVDEGEKMPSVDDVGFLPGLIVQGNTWNFIAAKTSLGSTGDIFGIYQIIASLQLLREWINATCWPWLRRVIQRAMIASKDLCIIELNSESIHH